MDITRLGFMKSSVGAALGFGSASVLTSAGTAQARPLPPGSGPVVAYVKDPASGTISLMSGDREVILHDHALAATLSHAAA